MAVTLGQKIKQLRKEHKITQQELAKGLVTASMISQIESDRATPSVRLLEDIANRLGIDPKYFMDEVSYKSDQAHTYRRAKALIDNEKFDEALPLLLTLIDPVSPHFREEVLYSDLALCYQKTGQLDEAVCMYDRVVQAALLREDVHAAIHAYFHLGHLERKRNQIAPARMFWQRASELFKRHPDVNMPLAMKIEANLGRVQLSLQQFNEALESYQRASSLAEFYSATLDKAAIEHGLATVYMKLKNFESAERHLERAIHLYQASSHQRGLNQCHINQCVIERYRGNYDVAFKLLTDCIQAEEIQQDPIRLASALEERASCALQLERFTTAVDDAGRALQIDKENTERQLHLREILAEAYLKLEEGGEALDVIMNSQRYIQEAIDRTTASRFKRLEYLARTLLGQSEQAFATAKEYGALLLASV